MSAAQPLTEAALVELEAFRKQKQSENAPWLARLRRDAVDRFAALGLPGAKHEAWKYTSLKALSQQTYTRAEAGAVSAAVVDEVRALTEAAECAACLVFVDGYFEASLSMIQSLPEGAILRRLQDVLDDEPKIVEAHLGHVLGFTNNALVAWNTGFINDGACLMLGDDVAIDDPIHIVFVGSGCGVAAASYPRSLIVMGRGARATVVESHVGLSGDAADPASLSNAATEVVVGRSATLAHHKLQLQSESALHVGAVGVRLARDSAYESCTLSLGAALARNEARVLLAGAGASCAQSGLYAARGTQHVDNHLLVDHAAPLGRSNQLYKGILDDSATGVFSGKVRVAKDAQKCDAQQLNRNLLIKKTATVNTRPTLEILTDDVKCSHGATIGQLDEEALFYMRSRGIDAADARRHLTFAFAGEVIEQIRAEPVRGLISARAERWLSQT